MSETVRTSVRLTPEMHGWYVDEAEKMGISFNALVIFALKTYMREETVLPNLPELFKAVATMTKPKCPKCLGEGSPNSVEMLEDGSWKCHECSTTF